MDGSTGGEDARETVDFEILREATGGDRDLMQELAELYVNDADLQLRALDDAAKNREMDRIRRIGHALCGASLSIGAQEAGDIFRELEYAARDGDAARVRMAIDRGAEEFIRVRKLLADLR